ADDDGVIAFCGERRTGKSTLAFALARLGLAQRADDAVVLAVEPDGATTVPVPFAPRLRRPSAAYFGAHPVARPDTSAAPAERLRAVIELRQDDIAATQVERLSGADGFTTLLAHSHCFDPGDPGERRRLVD